MTTHRSTRNLATGMVVSLMSLCAANSALAATWDFRIGGSSHVEVGSAWGNMRTFTEGSETVTVTAWADDGNPSPPPYLFRTAHSGQYTTGIGICNRSEALVSGNLANCDQDGGVRDQVDNVGQNDFMLFIFSSTQAMQSITIDPFGAFDRDVSYWIGTVSGPIDLTGLTTASLAGLGFGPQQNSFNGIGDPPLTIGLGNVTGNAILFGALYPPDGEADKFKIQSMVTNAVPVPAAWWLLASALGALGAARARYLKLR